ncbi:hypothetical protein A2U01_0041433, partial [Trifolium medium]|nr:hypothetical protein [Trifolium medium]
SPKFDCVVVVRCCCGGVWIWRCRCVVDEVSLYLVDLYRVGVDCLEADCELRLICLSSHSTIVPSTSGSRSYFLDSDGPVTFDLRSRVSV